MNEITVITGPTASGKTALALQLAANDTTIEIVNADASLLYRGFDIGTAKPDIEIRSRTPHHLIDILEPNERVSAADFSTRARTIIREIIGRGRTPLVVGGTGFYIDALFNGIAEIEVPQDALEAAKLRIKREVKELGFEVLHERLKPIDPELYAQIQRERNPLRLYRAWEHYYVTGEPLGDARKIRTEPFEFKSRYVVLQPPRPELWQRIEERTGIMLQNGWLDEAARLQRAGITQEMPAMKAIGYRELFDVLDGKLSLVLAKEAIVIRTRQYAKRQVTWMKRYTR